MRARGRAAVAALVVAFGLAAVGTTTSASGDPARSSAAVPHRLMYRYLTNTADGATTRTYGYDLVDVGPFKDVIDALPGDQRALVWIGDYDNATCAFTMTDDQVTAALAPLAHNQRIAGYYVADEPDDALARYGGHCTNVAAAVTRRTSLVHRLAPGTFTYEVVAERQSYAGFAKATDVLGAVAYPCRVRHACDWTQVPRVITALRNAHVKRYWAVVPAFDFAPWRFPTPAELRRIITQWAKSCWLGEQTFAYRFNGSSVLARPDLLAELARLNRTKFVRPKGC